MGAVPRSLLIAVRDIVVLLVIAFACGVLLDAWATHVDNLDGWQYALAQFGEQTKQHLVAQAAHPQIELPSPVPPVRSPLSWGDAVRSGLGWARGLALWVSACWVATRARAGLRTVWVPGAVATGIVVARSVWALVPGTADAWLWRYAELWPGPVTPGRLTGDGSVRLFAPHPGWIFPTLAIAVLLAASWLGARAGGLPDDRASRRVAAIPREGWGVAAVVVGLPAAGGAVGAVVGYVVGTRQAGDATTHSIVVELVAPLVAVVLAAALLSGTGLLGGMLIVVASVPVALRPVVAWADLAMSELALAETAGITLLCAAVALSRSAAAWGNEILGPKPVAADDPGPRDAIPLPPGNASNPEPAPPGSAGGR